MKARIWKLMDNMIKVVEDGRSIKVQIINGGTSSLLRTG